MSPDIDIKRSVAAQRRADEAVEYAASLLGSAEFQDDAYETSGVEVGLVHQPVEIVSFEALSPRDSGRRSTGPGAWTTNRITAAEQQF